MTGVPRAQRTLPDDYADVRPAAPSRLRVIVSVAGSPLAWVLHLTGSYVIVTAGCATEWGGLRPAILAVTAICVALAAWSGFTAVALWREGRAMAKRDLEPGRVERWDARMGERGARVAFLAVVSIGAAMLFSFLIVLQGLPPFFTPVCWAGTGS